MPQARGSSARIAFYPESTFKQDPGAPDGTLLYLTKCGLAASRNLLDSNTITASRARARSASGNWNAQGPLEAEVAAESIGKLLKQAMGAVASSGAGPYTHVFTLADLPVGFITEVDYGADIAGSGRVQRFNGCRVNALDLTFPTEGYVTAAFDVIGSKFSLAASALDATLTDTGHTPFSSFDAAIEEGGSAIATVTQASIKLSNDLDASTYVLGGVGERRYLPEGFATVTGSITALYEDASLLTKARDRVVSSLKITLSRGTGAGSAGNESIEFLVENLDYEPATPPVEGPRGLLATLNFKAFKQSTALGFKVTVKNALATI